MERGVIGRLTRDGSVSAIYGNKDVNRLWLTISITWHASEYGTGERLFLCLTSTACLESQGCHFIPIYYLLSFFCLLLFFFLFCFLPTGPLHWGAADA